MKPDTDMDLLIINGTVLTQEPGAGPVTHGYVAVRDGKVAAVGAMSDPGRPVEAGRVIDARGGLVMPGLVNTHVHAAMSLFRGLADDLPLMTWLQEYIFPAEAANVNEDLVYWGTRLSVAEMLLSGTTGMADGYFFEDQTARAVMDTGIRAVLGQGVLDFPAPGVPDPSQNLAVARDFIDRWQGVSPLLTPSVFCHSPYTCSAETLKRGQALARGKGVIFQIHVAETSAEVAQISAEHGLRPVAYLDSLGVLDEHTLAVHCVHMDEKEMDILARRGTPVSVCVESEMKLASGLAPVPQLLARGVRLSLGTDGPASNNDLNMFGEMRSLALLFKAAAMDPTILPAATVLRAAGPVGASALGWGGLVGTLVPGQRADLVVMNSGETNMLPLYNPASHLVYAATGREVRTVLVDGRVLVDEGRVVSFDVEETMFRVREIAARIAVSR